MRTEPVEHEAPVGREAELARIAELVGSLGGRGGGAEALVLAGEPGIGKSLLLSELCSRADEAGVLVLDGRAAEFEREEPFAVIVDALDDYLASLHPRRLELLPVAVRGELARIFPGLDPPDGDPGSSAAEERYRAHRAFGALLDRLAAERPVVVALDDLHWADEASVELLSQLLLRMPGPKVLIAMAYRSGQEPARLRSTIDSAELEGSVTRLELGALAQADAALLLGELDDAEQVATLYRRSGGNPFYLDRLGRAVRDGARMTDTVPEGDVPAAIAAAVRAETELLAEPSGELLRAGSVAGEAFDLDVAAEIAELSEDVALASLDELLAHDLVRSTDAPRQFRFRHPIVRGAVYDAAPDGWRLGAHGRAAEVLERRSASAVTRAHHLECSARPGDEAAIEVLSQAAQEAAARAPGVSAHWFGAALRLVPAEDKGARLGLLISMARVLGAVGRFEEARDALAEVLTLLPEDQHAVRGQVVAASSKLAHVLGEHEQAHALLVGAMEELPEDSSPEATALKLELGSDAFFSGDFERFRHWAGEALDDSRASGDLSVQTAATGLLGCAEYLGDRLPEARARFDEAEQMYARLADSDLARHLYSLTWWCFGEVFVERFEPAIERLDRGIAAAQKTGQGFAPTPMRITQGFALLWLGRIAEADERLDASIDVSSLSGNDQALSWALWVRAWSATLAGDGRRAIELGERAVEAAGAVVDPISALAGCYLAEARLEAGDPEVCRDGLLGSVGGADLPMVERGFKSRWYEILCRAELAIDDRAAAERWAGEAERAADGLEIHGRSCEALRARAAVLLAEGDAAKAAEHAARAITEAEVATLPIEAARSRILAGRSLAAAGDRDGAGAELKRAHEELVAIGAARYADEAAQELRRLGTRVSRRRAAQPAAGEGIDALSKREREVAELIADGRANKEIAAELFLSERTVETHLTRSFAKLGLSNRAQLAAMITEARG